MVVQINTLCSHEAQRLVAECTYSQTLYTGAILLCCEPSTRYSDTFQLLKLPLYNHRTTYTVIKTDKQKVRKLSMNSVE